MLLELPPEHLFSLAAMYTSGHFSHANDALITTFPGNGSSDSSNSMGSTLKNLPLKKRFSKRATSSFSITSSSNCNSNYNTIDHRTAKEFSNFNLNCLTKFDRQIFDIKKDPVSVFAQAASLGSVSSDEITASKGPKDSLKNNASVIMKGETMVTGATSHAKSDMAHLNPLNLLGSLGKSALECPESRHGSPFHHQVTRSYGGMESSVVLATGAAASHGESNSESNCQFLETCTTCNKSFYTENSFKIHLRRHLNKESGKYKCKVCGQTFSQRSGQVSHSRVHTREKPYLCDMCPKRFADFSTYTKHKRVHTGEKPYSCPCCHSNFSQSGNLHRHVRVVHKIQSTTARRT